MENQEQTQDLPEVDDGAAMAALELDALKTKANLLGVKFHPNIGYDSLQAKIKEHEAAVAKDVPPDALVELIKGEDAPLSKSGMIKIMRDAALALVRVNIVCMNPAKREWHGEIISVGNANLPTQKKFVPFNTPNGYHIPKIMFDVLKDRECAHYYDERVKTAMGVQSVRRQRRVPEFNIQVLPPLTPEQLRELARQQAAEKGVE